MRISSMRNLGPASAVMLNEIGIKSSDDLKSQDPVDVFILLKLFGFDVNLVMLWALYGAINDIDWREISESTKQELKDQLEEKEAA